MSNFFGLELGLWTRFRLWFKPVYYVVSSGYICGCKRIDGGVVLVSFCRDEKSKYERIKDLER